MNVSEIRLINHAPAAPRSGDPVPSSRSAIAAVAHGGCLDVLNIWELRESRALL